jgi:N-acetylmuramoyl-L-alanine amidase
MGRFASVLWSLRGKGLFIAAALASAATHAAQAEPLPADACERAAFRVVIDVGHTQKAPGAKSARGVWEYAFNLKLAERIEQQLLTAGFQRSVLLITEGPARKGLVERVKRANALRADLFLSIHHDSVPEKFKEKWEFEGVERSFSDRFSGHSIFISHNHSHRAGSLLFAKLLGGQLQKRGLQYTPHYTDRIMGNRQRLLIDVLTGVYRYDQLIVLRNTNMPAVLLEAGSIINREEELRMGSVEHQALISAAVADAVESFCTTRRARAPTHDANRAAEEVSRQATATPDVTPVRTIKQR